MKPLKIKPQELAFWGASEQLSKVARPSRASLKQRVRYEDGKRSTLRLTNLMLTLQKLLGTTLSGIAVSIQVGNVLVCLFMLLLGPAVVVNLLAK